MIKKPVLATKASLKKIQTLVNNPKLLPFTERRLQKIPRFNEGEYFRIIVRPRKKFLTFKSEPISSDGMLQQIHGQLPDKRWSTYAWLVNKQGAKAQEKTLVATTTSVTHLFRALNKKIIHVKDDTYKLAR